MGRFPHVHFFRHVVDSVFVKNKLFLSLFKSSPFKVLIWYCPLINGDWSKVSNKGPIKPSPPMHRVQLGESVTCRFKSHDTCVYVCVHMATAVCLHQKTTDDARISQMESTTKCVLSRLSARIIRASNQAGLITVFNLLFSIDHYLLKSIKTP